MELGLFQLENLFMVPSRFLFFDLRTKGEAVHPQLDGLLKKAELMTPEELPSRMRSLEKAQPVVLICQDGAVSAVEARKLEAAGYSQIYVVAGGVAGLLSEL